MKWSVRLGGYLFEINLYFSEVYKYFMATMAETKDSKVNGSPTTMIRMYNVKEYYKILEKVGRGTYGTVYKAKGLKDGRYYAIKKL